MRTILLVSSGQPAANPRLVKEARFFAQKGCSVAVIYCPISGWADKFDKEIISKNKDIKWILVGISKSEDRSSFLLVRLRKKAWTIIYKIFGDILDAALKSSVLFSQELRKEALKHKAEVYIGHNLGAIRAVVDASDKYNGKHYFDFEDFHRGEDQINSLHWSRVETIENKYVPKLIGAWAASPLITQEYSKYFPNLNIETINNCLPIECRSAKLQQIVGPELKLFWFSQTIGKNRGLEQIIQSIGKLRNERIRLTLLGNCKIDVKAYFKFFAQANGMGPQQITFINPVSEKEIIQIASGHHVGIASEVPHVLNRELCLTNKIFLYLLGGNAILFSNTIAQEKFATENTNIGLIYPIGDIEKSANCINLYFENRKLLNEHRLNSLEFSNKLNWEAESEKLINFLNLQ